MSKGVAKNEAKHQHKKARSDKRACQIAGCGAEYRSKGYCDKHFKMWRKGDFGRARYRICGKEACRKPVLAHGFCEAHQPSSAPAAAA